MKYKIIVDSSSNLHPGYITDPEVGFDVAPLTVIVDNKQYIDDGHCSIDEMLERVMQSKSVSSSSCPSPNDFLSRMTGADKYIVITIAQKLSGSYNSAMIAKNLYSAPEDVFVIDSKLVAGTMELMTNKAYELIIANKSFEEIQVELTIYRDQMKLLFILSLFDVFIKIGRFNKLIGLIASTLHIKPVLYGVDGEIKIKDKCRTIKKAIEKLIEDIGEFASTTLHKNCIISHTQASEDANKIKQAIESRYQFDSVTIRENQALCSYYAMPGGLIVCF